MNLKMWRVWLKDDLGPGPSEFDEQRSWTFQVQLIDGVVFVGILVVPTAPGAEPLPLAIYLQAHAGMLRLNPPLVPDVYPEVRKVPVCCG